MSPVTPPRHTSPFGPSTPPSRSRQLNTSDPLTPENRYPPARTPNVAPAIPGHLLNYRPNTPSTVQRAINTALPSTPPPQRGYGDYSSPNRSGTDTDLELTHIRPQDQPQSHSSPFHDRHSIIVDAVDDLPDGWSPGSYKMKTVQGYKFAGMRDDDTKEELEFGDELQAPVYISEKRRSLYPTTPTIPLSTLHDHPDLQPNGDHIGGQDGITPGYDAPVPHPRPPPVVPHFRRLLSLSSWRDICFLFIPGLLLAGATALVPPFMSIVIGDTFQVFSKFPIMTSLATPEQRTALLEGVRYQTIRLSAAGLFAIVANYIKAVVWSWHGEVVAARLREKVYQGVQEKGMDWFDMGMGMRGDEEGEEAVGAGGLMTKFSKETDDVRLACAQAMGNFFQFFGSFLLCFILAMIKSPVLSLVTLSTIPLVVIVQIVTQVIVMPIFSAERRGFAEASTNVERSTNAISTVKAHIAEQEEVSRFNAIVERVKGILVKQAVVWAASESLTDFLLLATFVSGFWYGAALVREGKLQGGAVMTVFWACLLASSYLQQAVPTLSFITKGKMSMASMLTVIQDVEVKEAPAKPPKSRHNKAGGDINISSPFSPDNSPVSSTFRPTSLTIPGKRPISMSRITPAKCTGEFNLLHVSFAYPSRPENPVLRDITLFIPPGETTFIVGGSGSGKSTIAQLLLRLYNPDGGEITLDDQSFPYLDEAFTRSNIAAVQQGCILFDMSVHDNVALGLAGAGPGPDGIKRSPDDVSRSEVEEACKMAMIHDFIIGLPEGYETRLGTGGSSLSGGQRQRLAIARARIRDPSILILDEATSALDATSRVQVFENLKAWRRNRTTIVITHDLSQIVSDDFVYVMKHGIVSEQGFRSDLMLKHPAYGQDLGVFASMAAEQAVEPVPLKWEEQATLDLEMMDDEREAARDATLPGMPVMSRRASNTGSFSIRPQSMAYFDILDEYARGMRTSGVPVQRPNMGRKGSSSYLGQAKPAVVTTTSTALESNGGVNGTSSAMLTPGRGMTAAQKRLSWGPQDLNPKASRGLLAPPSAYANASKTSLVQPYDYNRSRPGSVLSTRPGSRMSITRQGSFEGSPYSVTVTPSSRPVAARQRTLSQELDDELDFKYPSASKDDLDVVKLPAEHAIAITDEDKGPLPGIFRVVISNLPLMPKKWLFVFGLIGSVGHGVTTPVWASYLSRLMAIVAAGGTDPMLTTYAVIVLAICVAQAAANYIQLYSLSAVAAGWSAAIRSTAYQRVLVQDKAWFDRPGNAPAVLVQNLIKDADDMRAAVGEIAGKILVFVSMVTLGVVWAMVVQWRLTLVGLAIGPVFVVVVVVNEGLVGRAEMRNKDMRDRVGKMFYESVSNIRGIRAMALESTFREKFAHEALQAQKTGKMAAFYVGIGIAASACMPLFAMSLLNWIGCRFILDGYMDYPTMLMVFNLVLFSLTFGALALDFIPMMAKVKVAARDFNRLYNLSTLTSESAGETRQPISGNISFDNVYFSYPTRPDVPVLSGVSFRLRPGECIAIVGPSGSGKSTIAALLQRLYEPTHSPIGAPVSRITLDNSDLSSTDVKWLRQHIAVVSQTANLFDASVSDNIAYGSDVPVEEIHRAAKAANIHDFILSLPEGYDTNLGENASLISGGQAQRLQIARALVRQSQILILDEATSALDVENQRAILDTIVKIKETRTTIFITHSVEAMKRCDRIICLDNGTVAEDGSYEQLVRRNGVFAQLMKMGEWE